MYTNLQCGGIAVVSCFTPAIIQDHQNKWKTNSFIAYMFFISFSTGASQSQSQSRDVEAMAHARVDIRKLQQFLMGQQVNPTKSMCSEYLIHANKCVRTLQLGKKGQNDSGL